MPGVDPVAGHIPGAVNIPTVSHIAADGLLRPAAEIRATLAGHGIAPGIDVVVYCSSGIPSTHSALAFAVAGIDARVFVGLMEPVGAQPRPARRARRGRRTRRRRGLNLASD